MRIVRTPRRRGFAIIPNDALGDPRLSFRARGVLAYLLSRPDDWSTSADRLASGAPEGRRAMLTALSELERTGYLHRVRVQDAKGRWSTIAHLTDEPTDPEDTEVRLPNVGQPDAGSAHSFTKTDTKTPPTPRPGPRSAARPRPWCGACDERTRQIDDGPAVRRCPTCHPLEARHG